MRLWSFIVVFALAAGIGILIRQDPGYALFSYKDWTVEMPLWLAIVVLFVSVMLVISFFWALNMIFSSSSRFRGWFKKHRQTKSKKNTMRGLLELAEGRYKKAEYYLNKAALHSETPFINYLSAAKAAEKEGALERSDYYLRMAEQSSPGSDIAVKLISAKLQYKHGNVDQSIATLQLLHAEKPKHPEVLKLLAILYEAKKDWLSLLALLPVLTKARVFKDKNEEVALQQKVYIAALPIIADHGKKELISFWNHAPRSVTTDPGCQKVYVQLLLKVSADNEAEGLLRQWLQKNWQDDLGYLYGQVKGPNIKKQLSFAESLLSKYSNNAVLFLTLGRLSLANQLWGKARDYLEQSLRLRENAEAYMLLGQLMDRLEDRSKRDEYFKKGLFSITHEKLEH